MSMDPGSNQGSDNKGSVNFLDFTPEDIKSDPEMMKSLEKVQDLPSLIKSYVHGQRQIGKAVTIPGQDAKQEEWDAFYSKAGRPESPDKYEVKRSENLSVPYDEGLEKEFLATAHKLGFNNQQAQGLLNWWNNKQNDVHNQSQQETQKLIDGLKTEWGSAYDTKLTYAKRAFRRFGDEASVDFLESSGLGNHPVLLKLFARIGESLKEDSAPNGEQLGIVSTEEAKQKIADIKNNRNHAYHARNKPGHKEAVAEMERLFQIAYGGM